MHTFSWYLLCYFQLSTPVMATVMVAIEMPTVYIQGLVNIDVNVLRGTEVMEWFVLVST